MNSTHIKKALDLIGHNKIEAAIEYTLENLNSKEVVNELILIKSSYQDLKKKHTLGIIRESDYDLDYTRLLTKFVNFLSYIESSELKEYTDYEDSRLVLKLLVANGEIERALNILLTLSNRNLNSNYGENLLHLLGRYSLLQQRLKKGIINNDEELVERNKIRKSILEIIDDSSELLEYSIDFEEDSIVQEAKLIIVGEPGSGKTSMMKKLINPNYKVPQPERKDEESTVGINVHEGWKFPHVSEKDIVFKANLWDFGGQEIQYMTHQFFLTPESVYVLVADDRKQHANFPYWFEAIHLLGSENGVQSPILVVLNENNHKSITNFDVNYYRKKYPDTKIELCEVDLSLNDKRFNILRDKIQAMLCGLPHLGRTIPTKWFNIRNELIELKKDKNHVNWQEFSEVCQKNDVKKESNIALVSRYLHNLGVILHFQEDAYLKNFIILNIKWALEAVYSVLRDKSVKENCGKFSQAQLNKFWKGYKPNEFSSLLSLMMKDNFEICYKIPSKNLYIAPQLLENIRPEYEWNDVESMKFRYDYRFMPKGILTRLIVRKNQNIAGKGHWLWQTGVVLEYNGCKIQVIEDRKVKNDYIDIKVLGNKNERKFALRWVRDEIEDIHQSWFNNIEVTRKIQCDCSICQKVEEPEFHDYEVLLRYLEKEVDFKKCDRSLEDMPVKKLIDGVFDEKELERDKSIYFKDYPLNSNPPVVVINNNNNNNPVMVNNNSNSNNSNSNGSSEPAAIYGYLIAFAVIAFILAIIFQVFDIMKCLLFLIGTVLLVLLTGVLQLMNDRRITNKSFLHIISLIMGKIPVLGIFFKAKAKQ